MMQVHEKLVPYHPWRKALPQHKHKQNYDKVCVVGKRKLIAAVEQDACVVRAAGGCSRQPLMIMMNLMVYSTKSR
jgi:hypothetical protein